MSFEEDMLKYNDELFGFAITLCKNRHDAQDLLQETFIKAYAYRDRYVDKSLKSWLFVIMRNTYINIWRKKNNERNRLEKLKLDKESLREDVELHEHEKFDYDFFLALLDELKAGMDEIFFEVLVLVYVEDKSYVEASEILNIPMGTVMSRLYRARLKSQKIIMETFGAKTIHEIIGYLPEDPNPPLESTVKSSSTDSTR
jgi:RNA polymerase sigma-70 factor (ECF subfamily)